jgi:hypothetical protein
MFSCEQRIRTSARVQISDLFQTANGFLLGGSTTTTIQHTNTHITQNTTIKNKQTNKQNNENQISSQSHTNSEGHITASEYSVENSVAFKSASELYQLSNRHRSEKFSANFYG